MSIPRIPWSQIAEISEVFDKPLPLLREVVLGFLCDEAVAPPPFRRPFLAGATNLVSLTLYDDSMLSGTLLHFVTPTLTHLDLTFLLRTPTVGELLELLRVTPLMEDLQIHTSHDVLDASNFPFPDRFEPVDLPCLRNIHLDWTTSRSQSTLLRHIRYPPGCSVFMRFSAGSDVAQPPENTFPKSWEAFSLADLSCVTLRLMRDRSSTECAVTVKESNGASVSITRLQNVFNFVWTDEGGNLIREPSRDRDDNLVFSDAIAFIRKLPLRQIRKFVLEDFKGDEMSAPESFEIPPDLVKLICSDMPNLATLSLSRTCVSELLKMLTPPPPPPTTYIADLFDSDVPPEHTPPCPALRVLEIRHPDWVASRHCPEILALAQARKDEGIPFERVFFCSTDVPQSMALGMSQYAGEMDIKECDWCE